MQKGVAGAGARIETPSMDRFCPNCHGANVRRPSTPAADFTWRNHVLSRYQCRECLTQFWAVSQKTYVLAAAIVGVIVFVVVAVFLIDVVFDTQLSPPSSE